MDHYSILDQTTSSGTREVSPPASAPVEEAVPLSRIAADDVGKSLTEMAQRDLEAALQLLAERAQYITGASGAAIALLEDSEMICRASTGPSAPELGAEVQIKSGLTGESVRTRQVLRCDDAETDSRVNRESCRALGIKSVMVVPLVREKEVIGVFELLADRANAFEERDVTALERLAEMVQTFLEHADAAKLAQHEIVAKSEQATVLQTRAEALEVAPAPAEIEKDASTAIAAKDSLPPWKNRTASKPIPLGPFDRQNSIRLGSAEPADSRSPKDALSAWTARLRDFSGAESPAPLALAADGSGFPFAKFGKNRKERGMGSEPHIYTIGTVLIVVLTVVLPWCCECGSPD